MRPLALAGAVAALFGLAAGAAAGETVARHAVDAAWARERAATAGRLGLEARAATVRSLEHASTLQRSAEDRAAHLAVADPSSPELCAAVRLGAQAAAAVFAGAMAERPEIEIALGEGPRVRVPARVPAELANVDRLKRGLFLAMVAGDAASLDVLARVPRETLERSRVRADGFAYLFAAALQDLHRGDKGAPQRLLDALKATEPGRFVTASEDYVLDVAVFQMEALYRLLLGEAKPFNETLARALQAHRRYWSAPDRARDPDGFVAWGLLAIASLAQQRGMELGTESDYLPADLIRGRCRPR
jgi:Immunity protein 49